MDTSHQPDFDAHDILFEALAHQRRRYALRSLDNYDAPLALADLAEEVAVQEQDVPITYIPAEDVKQIYISLYHNHLPKLEEASLVRYDQETDSVVLADTGEQLEYHISVAQHDS